MEQSLEILHRDNYKVKQQLRDNTTHDYAKNDLKDTTMEQILKIFRDKYKVKVATTIQIQLMYAKMVLKL